MKSDMGGPLPNTLHLPYPYISKRADFMPPSHFRSQIHSLGVLRSDGIGPLFSEIDTSTNDTDHYCMYTCIQRKEGNEGERKRGSEEDDDDEMLLNLT